MAKAPSTRASLLVRLRDGDDEAAWTQFVQIYAPLMYGYARKHGLQSADAADLTQDVLASVTEAIRRFDYDPRRGSFRGWLFTIVRNKMATMLARQQKREQGAGDSEAQQRLEQQPDEAASLEEVWEQEYEQRLLHWAAEQLRPTMAETTWQAFWQTAVEGLAPKEVAERLQMSVAAVYMAKSRVLAQLKELIQEVQGEVTDA